MDGFSNWVPIPEAARTLGLTPQAIRKRIARGTLESRRNNRGRELVLVANRPHEPDSQPTPQPQEPKQEPKNRNRTSAPAVSLEDVRVLLGEQAQRMQAAHDAALARMQEQADSASVRAERAERLVVRLLTERARAPWWRRWLGGLVAVLLLF